MMQGRIEIRDLKFAYRNGEFNLRLASLDVASAETVAIIGPSGTGKTTLLNLIAGYHRPESGSILVNDANLSAMADGARREFRITHIGMVFQEFELLDYLHVLDNILLPTRVTPCLACDASSRERAVELARQVGIESKLHRNVKHLSQGERQRVAVCRALLPKPSLLLCDEPTGNLDPANKQHVLDILFEYADGNETTLLVVTHDHELLPRFDRVIDFREVCTGP